MKTAITTTIFALTLCAGSAIAQSKTDKQGDMRCFNGYAYTLKGGDYRYTEHHEQKRVNGKLTTWNVTYVGKSGKTIATKHMDFSHNPTVPTYTLKIPADGYMEGIRHKDGTWTMVRRESANAKTETKDFSIDKPIAGDSGFDPLVHMHFKELMSGKSVPFNFAAAGRQAVIGLKAHKTGKTQFEGKPAVVFEAQLNMFLIHYFVDSLKLTYDPETMRLLEYRGIGNMHNAKGDVYPVDVRYSADMPDDAKNAPKASCGSVADKTG